MRLGPDLSPYGSDLPEWDDLLPEELRYLCDVCHALRELGICREKVLRSPDAYFDRDELGIDPEEDADDA